MTALKQGQDEDQYRQRSEKPTNKPVATFVVLWHTEGSFDSLILYIYNQTSSTFTVQTTTTTQLQLKLASSFLLH